MTLFAKRTDPTPNGWFLGLARNLLATSLALLALPCLGKGSQPRTSAKKVQSSLGQTARQQRVAVEANPQSPELHGELGRTLLHQEARLTTMEQQIVELEIAAFAEAHDLAIQMARLVKGIEAAISSARYFTIEPRSFAREEFAPSIVASGANRPATRLPFF
jgi:hypothetical protein